MVIFYVINKLCSHLYLNLYANAERIVVYYD
jgi:hypothetical protein